jgi:hypothetical protein
MFSTPGHADAFHRFVKRDISVFIIIKMGVGGVNNASNKTEYARDHKNSTTEQQ